jgi:hypothetical protein
MADSLYREPTFSELCHCRERAVIQCRRCERFLCAAHKPAAKRRCAACETEYEEAMQRVEYSPATHLSDKAWSRWVKTFWIITAIFVSSGAALFLTMKDLELQTVPLIIFAITAVPMLFITCFVPQEWEARCVLRWWRWRFMRRGKLPKNNPVYLKYVGWIYFLLR